MKTAMQYLQEKITALINDSKGTGSNRDNPDYRIGLHQALGLIDLEAEKEQILEAYRNGFKDAQRPFRPMESYTTFEQYYQQTYKSDQ